MHINSGVVSGIEREVYVGMGFQFTPENGAEYTVDENNGTMILTKSGSVTTVAGATFMADMAKATVTFTYDGSSHSFAAEEATGDVNKVTIGSKEEYTLVTKADAEAGNGEYTKTINGVTYVNETAGTGADITVIVGSNGIAEAGFPGQYESNPILTIEGEVFAKVGFALWRITDFAQYTFDIDGDRTDLTGGSAEVDNMYDYVSVLGKYEIYGPAKVTVNEDDSIIVAAEGGAVLHYNDYENWEGTVILTVPAEGEATFKLVKEAVEDEVHVKVVTMDGTVSIKEECAVFVGANGIEAGANGAIVGSAVNAYPHTMNSTLTVTGSDVPYSVESVEFQEDATVLLTQSGAGCVISAGTDTVITVDWMDEEQGVCTLMASGAEQPVENPFGDVAGVATWAEDGMKWAVEYRVIGGKNVNGEALLSPGGNAIHAEAATM